MATATYDDGGSQGWRSHMAGLPLLFMHVAALSVFLVGFSWAAFTALLVTYIFRVFGLTAGYHRYFSHKSFKTSRAFQFVLAALGGSAAQLGPLWWAAHHRWHHQHADTEEDIHSPARKGFWWSHIGWLLSGRYAGTRLDLVRDFGRYPELRFLNRHPYVCPLVLVAALFGMGEWLRLTAPGSNTSGWQMLAWGFFLSTVLVYHVTFSINSLTHLLGTRRYETSDTSRNNALLAILTMGEGWHNNHHRFAVSARQGFFWWEIDLSYYLLKGLAVLGLVWDLRRPPAVAYAEARGR